MLRDMFLAPCLGRKVPKTIFGGEMVKGPHYIQYRGAWGEYNKLLCMPHVVGSGAPRGGVT